MSDALICRYCGSIRKNLNSYKNHERLCPQNEERIYKNGMTGKTGRDNQFTLAVKNGTIFTVSDETRQKQRIASSQYRHTPETKDKLSRIRTEYLTANPDKVPYLLNHYSKGPSYAERYWKEVLQNHKIAFEEQVQIGLYSLDFKVGSIAFEIDGEQHYVDHRIVESDKRRNLFLADRGIETVRVRWSHYQKLTLEQRQEFVTRLLEGWPRCNS